MQQFLYSKSFAESLVRWLNNLRCTINFSMHLHSPFCTMRPISFPCSFLEIIRRRKVQNLEVCEKVIYFSVTAILFHTWMQTKENFFLSMSAHDCTWWPVQLLERIKDAANKRPEQHPSHLMATRFFLQALVEKEILLQITIVFSPKWLKLVPEMNISEECFFFAYTASNTRPYVLSQTCFPECIIACHAFACFHVCVRIYVI